MTTLPSDLQQVLDEVEITDRAADTLVAGLSDEQFHWQPDGGNGWSIALCLEHLATANVVYSAAIRTAVDTARTRRWMRKDPSRSGFFGRQFVRSLEPPVTRRMRAPRKIRPRSGLPREEVLRKYHEAHAIVKQLIHDAATLDVNRATFQNPFLPFIRVRISTGFRVITAHNRRHLWQAEQVTKRPDFPRSFASSAPLPIGRSPMRG